MTIKQELFRDISVDIIAECIFTTSSQEKTILNSLMIKIWKPEKSSQDITKLNKNGLLEEMKSKPDKNLRI